MLASQDLQDRGFPSTIGSYKEALIPDIEGKVEVLDQRLGGWRRMAVDPSLGEF